MCLPSIVEEFLQQANETHLLHESGVFTFHDMLESEYSKAYGGIERTDIFFPFDPCLLRKSDRSSFNLFSILSYRINLSYFMFHVLCVLAIVSMFILGISYYIHYN